MPIRGDLEQILEASCAPDAEFRREVERVFARLTGADEAHFIPFDDRITTAAPDYFLRLMSEPRYHGFITTTAHRWIDRGCYIDHDICQPEELLALPFYDEVWRPRGLRSHLGQMLTLNGRALGVVQCNRFGPRTSKFTAQTLEAIADASKLLAVLCAAHVQEPLLARQTIDALTPREQEVAELAARGFENAQISAHVGRSVNTVRNQLHSAFRKLGVYSRVDLTNLVFGRSANMPARLLRDVSLIAKTAFNHDVITR